MIRNVTFLCSRSFAFLSCVLCLWSLSCLMKVEYQCLFHVTYEPYLNVRPRNYIIVALMLCKCRRFLFLCKMISLEALHSHSTSLPTHQTAQITFAFCALLKKKLLHLLHFIALAFTTKYFYNHVQLPCAVCSMLMHQDVRSTL